MASLMVTVDSDLLALGCETVVYDLNYSGNGECNILRREEILSKLELTNEDFLHMCIFLGCDYLPRPNHRIGRKGTWSL